MSDIIEVLKSRISDYEDIEKIDSGAIDTLLKSIGQLKTEASLMGEVLDSDDTYDSATKILASGDNQELQEAMKRFSNFSSMPIFSLFDKIPNNSSYWNQSVKDLINLVNDVANNISDDALIDDTNVTYDDLKKANAGYSFENAPWVRPNVNMYASGYEDVRSTDAATSVLMNDSNFDFTHTQNQQTNWEQIDKWIRLLMPENSRKVETEDLNRNFWVIAQVISAISGYLFDDNGSIYDVFTKILDEIVQLWDNIFYLWLLFCLQEEDTKKIHKEVITWALSDDSDAPMHHSLMPYTTHSDNWSSRNYEKTAEVLANKYYNKNFAVLAIEHENIYYKGYPRTLTVQRLILKHRTWESCRILRFCVNYDGAYFINADVQVEDFLGNTRSNLLSHIGAIAETTKEINGVTQLTNNFIFPASRIATMQIDTADQIRYYAALRIKPVINISVNADDTGFDLTGLTFNIEDAASQGQQQKNADGEYIENSNYDKIFCTIALNHSYSILERNIIKSNRVTDGDGVNYLDMTVTINTDNYYQPFIDSAHEQKIENINFSFHELQKYGNSYNLNELASIMIIPQVKTT